MRVLTIALCLCTLAPAFALPSQYTAVSVGTLGGTTSSARGINDLGQVSGTSTLPNGDSRAYHWTNGIIADLGVLPGFPISTGWGISNAGQVAGRLTNGSGVVLNTGFFFDGTTMSRAGDLGGVRGNAYRLNNVGQVAGNARLPSDDFSRAFLHSSGQPALQLPTLFPDDPTNAVPAYNGYEGGSYAVGINDLGHAVGSSGLTDVHTVDYAFLWTPSSGMQNLGLVPGYDSSYANGINNAGVIVGSVTNTAPAISAAMVWTAGAGMNLLPGLGGTSGTAYTLNESGLIVGSVTNVGGASRAVIWENGAVTDLNALLPAGSGWVLTGAYDINESGQIVGSGTFNGAARGFVLTPIPEPSSCLLLLSGALTACGVATRRTRR